MFEKIRYIATDLSLQFGKGHRSELFKIQFDSYKDWSFDGPVELVQLPSFYFSSKSGVYLFSKGEIYRIWGLPSFGVAMRGSENKVFVSSTVRYGRFKADQIFSFDFDTGMARKYSGLLRHNVHQIDWVDGMLYATECYHNSIAVINSDGLLIKRLYPAGFGLHKPRSGNYKHFNSIYSDGVYIWVFAHNKSKSVHDGVVYSDRPSQVCKLDMSGSVISWIEVNAINGHNIYVDEDGAMYYCDSGGSNSFQKDGKVQFEMPGWYVRGLAVCDDFYFIGGSQIGGEDVRQNGSGKISVLDPFFTPVGEFNMKGVGQIYDIRFKKRDKSSSANK